jgi:membrane-associated phospholipid phosphatase
MRPRIPLALVLAAAFGLLAVAVAHSSFVHRVDQGAARHVMPGLEPDAHPRSINSRPLPFEGTSLHGAGLVRLVADAWTLPASTYVSPFVFALGTLLLWRRGRSRIALVLAGAWVAGNAIEWGVKHLVERPAIVAFDHGEPVHIAGLDQSYPSGHSLRSVLLVALVGALWPRATWWTAAWAAGALVVLELGAFHVPSDIVGGALLGCLLIALVPLAARDTGRP